MRDDLIFHVTTEEYFQDHKVNNRYQPESLDSKGFIHCSKGTQIEATANRIFPDRDEILLLIIDISTLSSDVKYDMDEQTGEKYPHIYGPLNIDAIMDKLTIYAEDNGDFNIAFSSRT